MLEDSFFGGVWVLFLPVNNTFWRYYLALWERIVIFAHTKLNKK